jgi:hypothetical protein
MSWPKRSRRLSDEMIEKIFILHYSRTECIVDGGHGGRVNLSKISVMSFGIKHVGEVWRQNWEFESAVQLSYTLFQCLNQ